MNPSIFRAWYAPIDAAIIPAKHARESPLDAQGSSFRLTTFHSELLFNSSSFELNGFFTSFRATMGLQNLKQIGREFFHAHL